MRATACLVGSMGPLAGHDGPAARFMLLNQGCSAHCSATTIGCCGIVVCIVPLRLQLPRLWWHGRCPAPRQLPKAPGCAW